MANPNRHKTRPRIDIRPHPNNRTLIDEVFAEDVKTVHIEQMGKAHWWMALTWEDGMRYDINFTTDPQIVIDEDGPVCPIQILVEKTFD